MKKESDEIGSSAPSPAWWRRWGVVTLLVAVAAHQFYRVHAEGLSSWRGGGFGMYGSYHPYYNDLWWADVVTGEARRYRKHTPVLTYVNQDKLESIHENLPEELKARVRLGVWQLDFEPESGRLSRRELIHVEPNGQP